MKISLLLFALSIIGLVTPAVAQESGSGDVTYTPDVTYTLRTDIAEGKLVYVSEKGPTKGQINPDLEVAEGAVVQINITNGDGAVHDLAIPAFDVKSDQISGKGSATAVVFRASKNGVFEYLCTLPGHKAAGMFGKIIVGGAQESAKSEYPDLSKDPNEVGEPVGKRGTEEVTINLESTEILGRLGDGSHYKFWTFNDTVPGPMIRIREGDKVTVNMTNSIESSHIHSVDFHAVTGPGGGAAVTQVPPGKTKSFTFKALQPGLYVYHCATPMVAQHITNGMYGLILVEPEGGLSKVDKEFYVMQGELYTAQEHGSGGLMEFSLDKMLDERPEHMMFNGAMDALTATHSMKSEVGDNVRMFFGVGGPNLVSSFHVIGEIFDKVYDQASLTSPPLTDVQTTLVPAGGATMVEFKTDVPGKYILVDHALARAEKGLVGALTVTGDPQPDIFHSGEEAQEGGGH
jgi:nitrite reductase (NO-forming)